MSRQLQQRDNEIQILVAFIRKREATSGENATRFVTSSPPSQNGDHSIQDKVVITESKVTPRIVGSHDQQFSSPKVCVVYKGEVQRPDVVDKAEMPDRDEAYEL